MIFITKKKIIILVSSILCIILAAACSLVILNHKKIADADTPALAYTAPELILIEKINYGDTALNILCDGNATEAFGAEEASSAEISESTVNRNDHFEMETGTSLSTTVTEDFLRAAREDILAGTQKYNMYTANASSLAPLIASNELRDITGACFTEADGFYTEATDSLAIYGKRFLFAAAIADIHKSAAVLCYDRAKVNDIRLDGKSITELAASGGLTAENLIALCKANDIKLYFEAGDAYPIYFGMGGGFASFEAGELIMNSYPSGFKSFNTAKSLRDKSILAKEKEDAAFFTARLYELYSIKEGGRDIGVLPLPKAAEDSVYCSYIDADQAKISAMPKGEQNTNLLDALVSRYISLSAIYIQPPSKSISKENEEDAKMLAVICENAKLDLAVLFGYGDVKGLIEDMIEDDTLFAINYYNRKDLIEKAFSIIEKRIEE